MPATRSDYIRGCAWEARHLAELARQWIGDRDAPKAGHCARVAARGAMVVLGFRWSMGSSNPVSVADRGYYRPVTRVHSDGSVTRLSEVAS